MKTIRRYFFRILALLYCGFLIGSISGWVGRPLTPIPEGTASTVWDAFNVSMFLLFNIALSILATREHLTEGQTGD